MGGSFPNLHSIILTGGENASRDALPFRVRQNIESFQDVHPDMPHILYTDETLRAFIEERFDKEVLAAYDDLLPLAYKADLGRYCILYALGGIYSDVSNQFFSAVCSRVEPGRIHVFRDYFSAAPWIVSTSLIATAPHMPVFERCISRICEHVRRRYYGVNPLCPTGPNLFGAELVRSTELENIECGQVASINLHRGRRNLAYLSRDEDLISVQFKRSAGISTLGMNVDNDYNALYNARYVYASGLETLREWLPKDYLAQRSARNQSVSATGDLIFESIEGFAVYGPYIYLAKGQYKAEVHLSGGTGCSTHLNGYIDSVCHRGEKVIHAPEHFSLDLSGAAVRVEIMFEIYSDVKDLEVRLFVAEPSSFHFQKLQIHKIK